MKVQWARPSFAAVAALLGARTGLVFGADRREDIEAATRRAAAKVGAASIAQYHADLESGATSLDDLLDEVTVGETYFFRDLPHFEFIQREVIPDLVRRRGTANLRVWSAGCASGEEAYSLAIALDATEANSRADVLGTDISARALARARAASYGAWSLRGVDPVVIDANFRSDQSRWLLAERVRKRVTFEQLNLASDPYPAHVWGMDVIVCRNVLIYLNGSTIAAIARRFYDVLNPGAWLVAGPSDPTLSDHAPFETVVTPAGIFYRKPATSPRSVALPAVPPVSRSCIADRPQPIEVVTRPRRTLAEIRSAFDRGDYDVVLERTDRPGGDELAALRIRALANLSGSDTAARELAAELERRPLSPELHLLHAVLLQDLGRHADAVRSVKRALYLDGSLVIAHFLLGALLGRLGDTEGARRAYTNARRYADALAPDEALALGEGECARDVVNAVTSELARLAGDLEIGR